MKIQFDKEILALSKNSKIRINHIKENLTQEFLEECFIKNKITIYSIGNYLKELGYKFDNGWIYKQAIFYKIKIPNRKEVAKIAQGKRNITNLEKYGCVNVLSKESPIYEKRNITIKEKYGVDNVFQLESVKEKTKLTMIEKMAFLILSIKMIGNLKKS